MSTSLLYHAFGIRGYQYTRTDYQGGQTIFTIHQEPRTCRCSACGSPRVQSRGRVERRFRAVPIGSRATFVDLPIPRVECQDCGVVRQVKVPFADPRRSYTAAFERYALELGRHMTIRDVAMHLGVSWDLIKDIQKRDLSRRYARPKLKHLRHIAIDEIAIAKGHRYLTVVLDLRSGAVVFVGDGKAAKALKPFWKRLRGSKARIEAVAMDMSKAYREAVSTHLPKAAIVFDRFHVVKLFNEKLTQLRRDLHREATDVLQKRVLKGTRWLLLKNPENLDETRDEKRRLEEALALNKSLAVAYYMKEALRQFWEQPGKRFATAWLSDWIRQAEASGIKALQQMAKTLAAHRSGLLAYYDVPITSGPMEGTNNKIKTMKRQAYGFRDKEFLAPQQNLWVDTGSGSSPRL
jgi:transposase